jgi:hypothetical protein
MDIQSYLPCYLLRLHLLLEVESCNFTFLVNPSSYRSLIGR